jgi:hypothetical protein
MMDWKSDSLNELLEKIERVASEKRAAKTDAILSDLRETRAALEGDDAELVWYTAFILGIDVGDAGFKEFGTREFLNRSGRPRACAQRDAAMVAEYLQKRPTSRLSDTALMEKIGKAHNVSRSRAIEIITSGLAHQKVSGK